MTLAAHMIGFLPLAKDLPVDRIVSTVCLWTRESRFQFPISTGLSLSRLSFLSISALLLVFKREREACSKSMLLGKGLPFCAQKMKDASDAITLNSDSREY